MDDDKKIDEATKELEAALLKNPKNKEAYIKCAEVYDECGGDVTDIYEEAIKAIEDNADLYFRLAECQAEIYEYCDMSEPIHHWYEARDAYKAAIKKDPTNAHYLFQFGMFYFLEVNEEDSGHTEIYYDYAIEYLKRAQKLDPKNVEIQFHLGDALHKDGKKEEAIQVLQNLLKIDSTHKKAAIKLSELQK